MLTYYIENLIKKAYYEILEDGTYYGEIPGVHGVWANEDSLWECEQVLREVLEEWLIIKLKLNEKLPVVKSVDLNKIKVRGDTLVTVSNPHKRKDIGVDLLVRILKQARVSKAEFEGV